MDISIIILTYNSNDLIIDCIKSIKEYNDIGDLLEIIVVDNSEEIVFNDLQYILKESFGESVFSIRTGKNGGYGFGNNVGVKYAKGDVICIMNPDVLLVRSVFMRVMDTFRKKSNLSVIGGKQFGGKDLSFFLKPEYFVPVINTILVKGTNYFNLFLKKYFFLSGALLFIKKRDFLEIGKFDENIFLYGEESDILNRFLLRNKDVLYDKNIEYKHLISARTKYNLNQQKKLMDSRVYYFDKFNFDLKRYIKLQIIDLRVKMVIYKIFGKEELYRGALEYKVFLENFL